MTDEHDSHTPDILTGAVQPPVFDLDVERDDKWPMPDVRPWAPVPRGTLARLLDLARGKA